MKIATATMIIFALLFFPCIAPAQTSQPDLNSISEQLTELKQEISLLTTKLESILLRLQAIESKLGITEAPKTLPPKADIIVYVTKTGKKYHRLGCRYLKQSCIEIKKNEAIVRGYTPCSVCNPP